MWLRFDVSPLGMWAYALQTVAEATEQVVAEVKYIMIEPKSHYGALQIGGYKFLLTNSGARFVVQLVSMAFILEKFV